MCFGLCPAILRKRSALPVLVERSPCSRPKRKADWPLFKTCSVIGELALHMTSPRVHLLPMGLVCFRIRCISVDSFSTKPHSSAVSEVTVVNTWLFQSTFTSLMEDSQSLILAGIELSSAGLMGSLRPARSPGCSGSAWSDLRCDGSPGSVHSPCSTFWSARPGLPRSWGLSHSP